MYAGARGSREDAAYVRGSRFPDGGSHQNHASADRGSGAQRPAFAAALRRLRVQMARVRREGELSPAERQALGELLETLGRFIQQTPQD